MKHFQLGILAGALGIFALFGKVALDSRYTPVRQHSLALKPLSASYEGNALRRSSFGFQNLIADLLWIKLLQGAQHTPLKEEQVSWEYAQLQAITTLDPQFQRPYEFGAAYLSVFRRDKLGARLLLEAWARRRPHYWRTHYLLGYHLFFEMGLYSEAAKEILRASSMESAPPYLTALGIRLLSETGALWQSLELALEIYPGLSDAEARYRLKKRIRSLRFALEKARWQDALQQFRRAYRKEPERLLALVPLLPTMGRDLSSMEEGNEEDLATLLHEKFQFHYDSKTRSIVAQPSEKELGIDQVGIYRPKS